MGDLYVVWVEERLRDGTESWGKVLTKAQVGDGVSRIKSGYNGDNISIRVFRLGEEVQLKETVVEESETVVKKKTVYELA